ncbi:metallopeptidase TldD-related protein [Aestuariimicrobium ganziense]|uniref:metallopeptidase TldD-related protein n=1 Tax=Aestuariimicrobium ganziense TaxID=2773677 RepID=UPI0019418765|nr:metallopeptidase TldD-related protein [Aestuariimicrobium ganziense]
MSHLEQISQVNDWIEQALQTADGLPGTEQGCVVIVNETSQVNLRWANNHLTTNGIMHSRTGQVVALAQVDDGVAAGCLDAPVASADDLVALVRAAARAATQTPADPDAMPLADGGTDDDFGAAAVPTSVEVFSDLAAGLGAAFEAAGEHHLFFGFAEHTSTTTWLGTTAGTRRRAVTRLGRMELNAKHPDMIGSAWVGRATTDFSDVDIAACVDEVLQRLAWCENRIELPAGSYETILPGSAVADLLIYAYWTSSGRDAREGRTVFAGKGGTTRVGERLATLPVSIWSDPTAAGLEQPGFAVTGSSQAGTASVFDNGLPAARVDWLRDGRLVQLIETRAELAKTGGPESPLPWPTDNLLVDAGGTASLDEMIASTKRGLLLTCLWYIREVDPETLLLTGLTRDGVYLVEDGRVTGMVNNFRWNESPISLLGRATEASVAEKVLCREWNDWFTLTSAPALRVPDFTMSTVSKAY